LNLNIFDEYPKTILEESIKLFTELYQNYNVITFPLKQEIFFSKRYIQIQKMQLGNLFAAKWTIEPGLENYIVPKLCIQTYVENFFKYGITNANQINKIDILIKKENNYICIEIEDNGLGLSINNSHVLKSKTGLSTINVLYDYVNLFSHNLIEYSFINKQDIDKEKTGIKIILKIPDNIPELSLDKQQINPIIALNYFKLKIKKLWKKYIKLFW